MRRLLIAASLLFARGALAEPDDAKAFRDFVTKSAEEDKRWISEWYATNLDGDAAQERVAVLCSPPSDDPKGYFIIEKDPTHRWELTFDVDSRTRACKGKAGDAPKWESRKTNAIELYQGHLAGHESTSYALRLGQPVIVREEETDDDAKKATVKDWDQLVKKKKAKYQAPDRLRQLNNVE